MTQWGEFGLEVDVEQAAFIHPTALIYGKVTLAPGASMWPHAVIRCEAEHVRIGAYTNIQDFVMIHASPGLPVEVGAYCSITHHATLHACKVGDNCLIGINATIMDGAVIGNNCIVAGHSIVTEGGRIPDNSVVAGSPAKVLKTKDNQIANKLNASLYHRIAVAYAQGDHRAWSGAHMAKFIEAEIEQFQAEIKSED